MQIFLRRKNRGAILPGYGEGMRCKSFSDERIAERFFQVMVKGRVANLSQTKELQSDAFRVVEVTWQECFII